MEADPAPPDTAARPAVAARATLASPAPPAADGPADAPGRFDTPWHALAALPRGLWLGGVTCSAGTPVARLPQLQTWRAALEAGTRPPADAHFGDPEALAPLREAVGTLDLPALARGIPAVAEQVLRTLLWHLDRIADLQARPGDPADRAAAIAQTAANFHAAWTLQKVTLEPELFLVRQWADTAHLRWDELTGRLHAREWQAARRAAERLATLPELVSVLQRLGRRTVQAEARPAAAPEAAAPTRTPLPLAPVATRLPGAPGAITGIRLGGRPEQMLPAEALALRHPLLRRLWRARLAEGRLLAHDTEAVVTDWRPDPRGRLAEPPRAPQAEPLARGPVLLCLDTSGSMRGAPENIAKAVAIAALRLAHEGGRPCRLIAFGGPGELLERDLGAGRAGLDAVLALMAQAFDGGTDVQTPIERAVELVHEAGWHGADLLIVSDGEFGCVRATLDRLDAARARLGLFVQGVLVGDRETLGLLEVCDHIHWVRDWRRHGEDGHTGPVADPAFSPVHSQSLTALFFPGALSPQAARHAARHAAHGGPPPGR